MFVPKTLPLSRQASGICHGGAGSEPTPRLLNPSKQVQVSEDRGDRTGLGSNVGTVGWCPPHGAGNQPPPFNDPESSLSPLFSFALKMWESTCLKCGGPGQEQGSPTWR